jgi:hypothetical protein
MVFRNVGGLVEPVSIQPVLKDPRCAVAIADSLAHSDPSDNLVGGLVVVDAA